MRAWPTASGRKRTLTQICRLLTPISEEATGFARGHLSVERLLEITFRIVAPPVAPVALLLHCAAEITNRPRPMLSATTTQATVVVTDIETIAYWRVTFRQWDSWRRAWQEPFTLNCIRGRTGAAQILQGHRMKSSVTLSLAESVWIRRTFFGGRPGPAKQKNRHDQDDDGDNAECYVHVRFSCFLFLFRAPLLYPRRHKFARSTDKSRAP